MNSFVQEDIEYENQSIQHTIFLIIAALGIVYGDIGTSPLYAFRECFSHGVLPTSDNVLGITSLIFWSIIIVVCLKYLIFVLRADNRGEGGILALMALVLEKARSRPGTIKWIYIMPGIFGASLLYGDGVITPAISVLSAVEGLQVVAPGSYPYITAITVLILFALFFFQSFGTRKMGTVFGPVILVWFTVIGIIGLRAIFKNPAILNAINPLHALSFIATVGPKGIATLGAVFLALTGAEAMYADMGHFGKVPIRVGWFLLAFPALILNYLGQGALVLANPALVDHPFYHLVPTWGVLPLVILATLATVIASQALISGAFSITSQAMQLGYFPRVVTKHTSSTERGQIYIPFINWALLAVAVILVLSFHTSSNLAAAYGIAVSTTMVITTFLVFFVATDVWGWSKAKAVTIFGMFLFIDLVFFFANAIKFLDAGWVPLFIGGIIFTIMTTWYTGRKVLLRALKKQVPPFEQFFSRLKADEYKVIEGTSIFMIRDLDITPPALIYNIRHNKVLHEKVILLSVITEDSPHVVGQDKQLQIISLGNGFYRVIIHSGFMETPNVMEFIEKSGLKIDLKTATFFTDRAIPIPTPAPGMAMWREKLFAFLSQNAQRPTSFYRIPAEQVIEIGFQVEI